MPVRSLGNGRRLSTDHNCGNFAGGRKLHINGTQVSCNTGNWTSISAREDGGYCVHTTPGDYAYAFFTL